MNLSRGAPIMTNTVICPICKSKLEKNENDTMWFCRVCGFPKVEDLREKHNDTDPIDDVVINNFFYLIAHEYKRLLDMLKNREIYGALLQVKDVWEILLKYPVLLKIGYIYQFSTAEKKQILFELFKKPLSLGDWRELGNKLNNLDFSSTKELDTILANILKLYNAKGDNDIVNWRNEAIGHGALSIDKDSILNDINQQVQRIREHFKKCDKYYRLLLLKTKQKETEFILKGTDCDTTQYADNTVALFDNNSADITPFIFLYSNEMFFYDTFSYKTQSVLALDYINGIKKEVPRNSIFFNIFEEIKKDFAESLIKFSNSQNAEQPTLLQSSQKFLEDKIDSNDRMMPAKYLYNWLIKGMQKDNKGIFFLRMAKGMGKTTFCSSLKKRKLYSNKKNKNALTDMGVSVYVLNLNDTTLCKKEQFISDVTENLKSNRNFTDRIARLEIELQKEHLSQISTKEQFVDLLRVCKNLRIRYGWDDKILLVIDGLDEIPEKYLNDSIIDLIPDEVSLPEDFYILLTARTSNEINSLKERKIEKLEISTEKLVVYDYSNSEYQNLLKKYANKFLKDQGDLDFALSQLSDSSQSVFTEFALLIDLIVYDKNNITALKNQKNIIKAYFEFISSLYTKKFSQALLNYVLILANSYEPLSIKTLSVLNGEDFLSFGTLGRVKDLNSVLKIERGKEGNLISLSHSVFIDYIKENYCDASRQIVEKWINYVTVEFQGITEEDGVIEEADLYILSYFLRYCEDYEFNNIQYSANARNNIITTIKSYAEKKNNWYNTQDNYKLRNRDLHLVELFETLTTKAEDKFLANYWRGLLYYSMLDYHNAKQYLGVIVESKKTISEYHNLKVSALLIYSKIMEAEDQIHIALRNLLIAKKIVDADIDNSIQRIVKERLFHMLAHIYNELGKKDKAISLYNTLKTLVQNEQVASNEEYLFWLDAVINTNENIDKINIEDIKERWREGNATKIDKDLLLSYCLRLGQLYMNNNMIDKAIQVYNEGCSAYCKGEGEYFSESYLDVLLHLTTAYIKNNDIEKSDIVLKKINEIYEQYQKCLFINLKANYFLVNGVFDFCKNNFDEAINSYDNGITILKKNTDFDRELYGKFLVKKIDCLLAYDNHDQTKRAETIYNDLKEHAFNPYYQDRASLLKYVAEAAYSLGIHYGMKNNSRLAEEKFLEVRTQLEEIKGENLTTEEEQLLRLAKEKLQEYGYFSKVRHNNGE